MVHNPNSPWRKNNGVTQLTAGSENEMDSKINELENRGFILVKRWTEFPNDVASSVRVDNGNLRRFYGTYMKRYKAIMKRGN